MIRHSHPHKPRRTRPQTPEKWKIEPLPARAAGSEDLGAPEIVALLAAAYNRIGALEMQMSEMQAGSRLRYRVA
jgi:hypothetical protein